MIFLKFIDTITLGDSDFTIFLKNGKKQHSNLSQLDKIYIKVFKNNNISLLLFSLFFIVLFALFFFLENEGLNIIFASLMGIFLLIINKVSQNYLLVIKFICGNQEQFILKPEQKIKLISKMRNIRAAADSKKFKKL